MKYFSMFVMLAGFAGFMLFTGCAPASINLIKQSGIAIEKKNGDRYGFSRVNVERKGEHLVVAGLIRVQGLYLRGHVDLAIVDPNGKVLFSGSVSPNRSSRLHGRAVNMETYSFRYELSFAKVNPPEKSVVRLSVHDEKIEANPVYDCGRNSAL